MSGAESFAIGAAAGAVVAATAYVISKHQASERQRQVAEARARAAYARLAARERHHRAVAQGSGGSNNGGGHNTVAGAPKKLPRYIAVDTVKDEHTSPKAQKSVMIFDTESQKVVGNDVYDLGKSPQVGSTAKIDTYSAEYVGTGS